VNLVAASAAVVAGIAVWWLAARRLTTKPWEAQGTYDGRDAAEVARAAPARVGLWVFLAVATSLFALFVTAYFMRMNPHFFTPGVTLRDWRPVQEPSILWFNTALLLAGSAGMQVARHAFARQRYERAMTGLWIGGGFAIAFLVGQWLAWRELQAAGVYAAGNPANAFFYVLTALHGAHVLGGLVVWGRAVAKTMLGNAPLNRTRLSVDLCTVYWHFLLVVWLVLFALLLIT
jgi:cytochrome c oxidase subunit 3